MKKLIGKLAAVLTVGLSLVFASCTNGVSGTAPKIEEAYFASQYDGKLTIEENKEAYMITSMDVKNPNKYRLAFRACDPDKDVVELRMCRAGDFSKGIISWKLKKVNNDLREGWVGCLWSNYDEGTIKDFIGSGPLYLEMMDAKGNVGTFTIPGITITSSGSSSGGSSGGGSTVKAKDMELIEMYIYNNGDRTSITEGPEFEAAVASFGAVQVKVNDKTDNEYRIEKITGNDFLVENAFKSAMGKAGYQIYSIGGYRLDFWDRDGSGWSYTFKIKGAKY